jgi:hypothetical protein
VRQEEIRATFASGWRVLRIDEARFVDRIHEGGAQAWRASLERVREG